jgi:TonB-dependent receptor
MRLVVGRWDWSALVRMGATTVSFLLIPVTLWGQTRTGTIAGRITDSTGTGLAATVHVIGNARFGVYAEADGQYSIPDVPVGQYRLEARFPGFKNDTFPVTVVAGQTVMHTAVLHAAGGVLKTVVVTGTSESETQAAALEQQKNADNIVTVMSGDEIRSLPNSNAAEALARLPGVTAERDEGESKYVEIRGTPPDFQHVTIDGADVPGTLATDVRAVKLDDVPSDLLGSIEVSKTLTADQSADAIGGSVNLVTKIPEGAPHGYFAGNYGYTNVESNSSGWGSATYGGRLGEEKKFGFLLSGSYDRTNRVINDVEPSFTAEAPDGSGGYYAVPNGSAFTHVYPSEWSEREYNYYRTRYGLGGDLDYQFSPTSSVYLKGLWSAFFDQANRWETAVSAAGDAIDTVIGGRPTITDAGVQNTVTNRGPIEHTWGFTSGTKQDLGPLHVTFDANYAGSTATTHNHLEDDYNGPSGFSYAYNSSALNPRYFISPATAAAIGDASNYGLTTLATDNELNNGQVVGARADALLPYTIGGLPASFKFGIKYGNEHKGYLDDEPQFSFTGSETLASLLSSYRNPSFYKDICPGCFVLAPFGSLSAVEGLYHSNPGEFSGISGQDLADNLNTFAGTEQVLAGYVMQTLDVDAVHFNLGLRVENTNVGYAGHVLINPSDTLAATVVHGTSAYTDLFPSLQIRYALDQNTNLRAAVTRGIARPDYVELAPSFNGVGALPQSLTTPISEGNPALKPEHAWNYDILGEHYFPSVGVLQGGVFYKSITNFIFPRTFIYTGNVAPYARTDSSYYYVNQYQNGPSAQLWGTEVDWTQHLTFLPGFLKGLGYDVNWTHVESRATVPIPGYDSTSYTTPQGQVIYPYANTPYRHSPIPRQFPNIFNASLLYDRSTIAARVAGQYTSASIYQYGIDGTSNPVSGDAWNYPHWQIDGSLSWVVRGNTALVIQGTNINNAVFGFFTGLSGPGQRYDNQREYYGSTWWVGIRQGL